MSVGVQQLVQTGFDLVQLCFTIDNEIAWTFFNSSLDMHCHLPHPLKCVYMVMCYTLHICILNCVFFKLDLLEVSWYSATVQQKYLVVKGKVHSITGHEVPEKEQRYGSTLSLTLTLAGGGCSMP